MNKGVAAGILALMLTAPTAAWAARTSAHHHGDERRGRPAAKVTRPEGRSTRGGLQVQPDGGRGGISGDFDVQPQGGRGGISGDV